MIIYNVENEEFQQKCKKETMVSEWQDTPVVLNSANTYSYTRGTPQQCHLVVCYHGCALVSSTFRDYVNKLLKPQDPHTLGNGTHFPTIVKQITCDP